MRDVYEPRDFQGSSSETDSRDRHRMESIPKTLCPELARVTEVDAGLRALLENYGTSPIREPSAFLDASDIELDNLQFLQSFCTLQGRPGGTWNRLL